MQDHSLQSRGEIPLDFQSKIKDGGRARSDARRTDEIIALAMEKYLSMVYRLAHARTGSKADAEDVTQEVMLKLMKHTSDIEGERHLKAWLIRVTVNECAGLFRSAWFRHTAPMEADALRISESPKAKNEVLDAALRSLRPYLRVVIHLYYYENMSTEEIAQALQIKPGTVRDRLHRARKKLKYEMMQGGDADV